MAAIGSYDILERVRDVSSIFNKIALPQTPLLNAIATGPKAENTKVFWWDDQRIPISTTLGALYDQSEAGGVMTVASSTGLRVGSIIRVAGQVKRVTVVTNDTTITTTHIGGASDADIASATLVEFVGNASVEGKDAEDSDYTPQVERYNVTQIFDDYVKLTGTQENVSRETAGDLLLDQLARKMERLRLGLGRAIWTNPRVSPSDNSTPRVMGGAGYFVKANGYAPSAATFSADNFDAFLLELNGRGHQISEAWMNPVTIANFSALHADKLIFNRTDTGRGTSVKSYMSKYGYEVELKTDANAPVKEIYCFHPSEIKQRWLRPMTSTPMGKKGDYTHLQIVGEVTLEVNESSTMGVFTIS